ncbi:hypothetical protein CAC42_7805 [Sphaceloma murrayae]|uniref:Uncharacterized protein n=1 Tax=Sphaceloma murrayae TaxID=2082308 RepID=A0A2K1QXQ7_9PEZI|nr:hypothetical protein CAC42_7805 [Sphaceloma murrayae]
MSDYDDGRRYRSTRTRPRDRGDPEYVREETYVERGKGPPPRDLVYRHRDDSVEDIPRDFPPPNADRRRPARDYYDDPPRRARSAVGRSRRYDDYDDDYDIPAAAGAAGYAAGRQRERRRHRDYDREYDSDSPSPHRRRDRDRRKSGVGEVLEGLGLGGVAGALLGGGSKDRSRSRDRHRDRDSDRDYRRDSARRRRHSDSSGSSRSRSRGGRGGAKTERKWAQAAQAALVAGAVEAFRSRKEPGPWTGDKGRRIATAALGAGGIDGLVDRDPDKKSKRHLAEAVIGGLAANRLANGPRGRSVDANGRPRSRSRSRSIFGRSMSRGRGKDAQAGGGNPLKEIAAGGALAAAGKAIYDRVRSKSRRRRSPSTSSTDSYEPPSRNRRPRGGKGDDTRSRASDITTDDRRGRGQQGLNALPAAGAAAGAGAGALAANGGQTNRTRSLSSSSSSTDLEDLNAKRKHMRGKEFLTAGLATIATIHAAHGVYSSMEAHEKRHKLVAEGEMTPEEARKKQTKAWVQDAAAVGIASLGIKGAFSEWKEMNEHRKEIHDLQRRKREKAKRRERREKLRERNAQKNMMQMYQMPMMMGGMQGMQGMNGMNGGQMGYGMPQQQMYQPEQYQYQDQNVPPPPGPPPNRY